MTVKTLSVNSSNDIYLGSDGNIAVAYDLEATLQGCAQAAKTRLGEVVLNTDIGIPYFEEVWVGVPNIEEFVSVLRGAFFTVPGVIGVQSIVTARVDDILTYTAVIETEFGTGEISG